MRRSFWARLDNWLRSPNTAKIAEQRITVMLRNSRDAEDGDLLQRLRDAIIPVVAQEARVPAHTIAVEFGLDPKVGQTMAIRLPPRRGRARR